jgi:hypothetical protein
MTIATTLAYGSLACAAALLIRSLLARDWPNKWL